MLPTQLVEYGLQHISLDPEWFVRDAVARHLDELLRPVSLVETPLIPPLHSPPPSPDPLPSIVLDLARAFDHASLDTNQVVEGWPKGNGGTREVVERVRKGFKIAEGRNEGRIAAEEDFTPVESTPDSPVLSNRALRETPRFADDRSRGLALPQTMDALMQASSQAAPLWLPTPEEMGDRRLRVDDVLPLKPSITKVEHAEIAVVLSRVLQGPSVGKKKDAGFKNPILDAAERRREMLVLVLDKEWVSFREIEAGMDEPESISPPLFPRRLDSAYYSRPERASNPQVSVRQVLPCDLDQVGKSLFDLGGKVEMDVELDDDLGPMEVLDAIQGNPTLPSDITFSLPSSSAVSCGDDALSLSLKSSSPLGRIALEDEEDLDVLLPRRQARRSAEAENATLLSPLNLRAALQQIAPLAFPESAHATLPLSDLSVSPVVSQSLAGAASTQEDRDTSSLEPRDLVEDVLDLLAGPGRTLLKEAEELVGGGALAKEEESDFPIPSLPTTTRTEGLFSAGPLAPSSSLNHLAQTQSIVRGGFGANIKVSGLLSLELELNWKPQVLVPAVSHALEFDWPSEDALDQEHLHRLGQLLQQSSSTSLSGDRSSCGPVDEQSDSSFIFTRRESARATAITCPSPTRDTDASPPRKRLLRDLSDESDGRLGSQGDKSAYQLFASASRSASPLLPLSLAPDFEMNEQLESMVDESAEESEDEPVQLAEGEEEMVMDVPVQQPVSPESQSPPRTYTSSTPTFNLPKQADGDGCTLSPSLAHRIVPSAALGAFLSSRAHKPVKPTVLAKQLPTVNDCVSGGASPSPREDQPANRVDLPENLSVLDDESPLFDDGGQIDLHAVGGQKLLNNHKAWKSLSAAGVHLHYRASPLLTQDTPSSSNLTGVDAYLTPHVALIVHSLAVLPSILPALRNFLPSLRHRVDTVYLLFTTPSDRDVWSGTVRKAVGQLRRSSSLLSGGEGGYAVKVGWVEDGSLGKAARRLMVAHQFRPEGAVPCLGGDWLGALEHDGDEQWEMDELNLSEFPGLNAFSSAWILFNIDIDDFLRLPPVSRLDLFGPLFGHERMRYVNTLLDQRLRSLAD